jgi:hypothetical protein
VDRCGGLILGLTGLVLLTIAGAILRMSGAGADEDRAGSVGTDPVVGAVIWRDAAAHLDRAWYGSPVSESEGPASTTLTPGDPIAPYVIGDVRQWDASPAEWRERAAKYVAKQVEAAGFQYQGIQEIAVKDHRRFVATYFHRPTQMEFVLIPGYKPSAGAGEATSVAPVLMSRTEVFQALWAAVMKSRPFAFVGDRLPAESLSWCDAARFCMRTRLALPTTDEWEHACLLGDGSVGTPAGSEAVQLPANLADATLATSHEIVNKWLIHRSAAFACGSENDGYASTSAGGALGTDLMGLYDMRGNVWEWTDTVVRAGTVGSGASACSAVGGGWASGRAESGHDVRLALAPFTVSAHVGFRVVHRLAVR